MIHSAEQIKRKIKAIQTLLPHAFSRDRAGAASRLRAIKQGHSPVSDEKNIKELGKLEKKIRDSVKKRNDRIKTCPKITFDSNLPIVAKKDEIIRAIKENRALIISGATGSGKSTQLPKFCVEAGLGIDGMIGCTQPRRIAAVSIASRIALEMGEQAGGAAGHKIRFEDQTSDRTWIKIMTDGMLLAETRTDPNLSQYDVIIVDEAHERSLNIDFILGYLRTLLEKRADLKVIITSATIDTEKFSKAFGNAPVLEIEGRMFPVETVWFPMEKSVDEIKDQSHIDAAAMAVDWLYSRRMFGDILIFMPTERDIHETVEILRGRDFSNSLLLPLYARMPRAAQSQIFKRISKNKIVIATNVAETSITIPGIKYVIDTGLARISRYSPRLRTTSLPVDPISKSSADQRMGRCGRVEKGVCIRLYSEEDYDKRSEFTPPEIMRSNLAEVILRMIALNLGDMDEFPFIDRPAPKSVQDGFNLLLELGAIVRENRRLRPGEKRGFLLTKRGRLMARLPIDPRLSRILIEAKKEGCLNEAVAIVSVLSIRDPRERPQGKRDAADKAQSAFTHPLSDFMTLLNIWNQWQSVVVKGKKDGLSKTKIRKKQVEFCAHFYLSHGRIREWRDICVQISEALSDEGFYEATTSFKSHKAATPAPALKTFPGRKAAAPAADAINEPLYAAMHKSILSGFLSNIAVKKEKNLYSGAQGKEALVFPGSVLFNQEKPWIVASEMVKTSRLFARTAAAIDNAWLEELGGELCKYTHLNPRWEKKRGQVVADRQASLFGLIIFSGQKVSHGLINPEEAQDIFVRRALVDGDIKETFGFIEYNQEIAGEARDIENRLRKKDFVIDEHEMAEFYRQRLPRVWDTRTLAKRIKEKNGDGFLRMDKESLFIKRPDEDELSQYPDTVSLGSEIYTCRYDFKPGGEKDGLTIVAPAGKASPAMAEPLGWLVPGLLKEKVVGMIKNLPKAHRKLLAPASRTASIIVREMPMEQKSLEIALSRFILKRFKVAIPAPAWSDQGLPDHLKPRISITGSDGAELAAGRDLTLLGRFDAWKGETAAFRPEIEEAKAKWEKTDLSQWDFPDLPKSIEIKLKTGDSWVFCPGLEQKEGRINLRLFSNDEQATASHMEGTLALFSRALSKDLKFLKKSLALPPQAKRFAVCFGGAKQVEKKLCDSVIKRAFFKNVRTKTEFDQLKESFFPTIIPACPGIVKEAALVMEAVCEASQTLDDLEKTGAGKGFAMSSADFFSTLKKDLSDLAPDNFMEIYETNRLTHIARYAKAISIRARRAVSNPEKEIIKAKKSAVYSEKLRHYLTTLTPYSSPERKAAIESFFWLLEEYKVSLFAQELKTAVPVSEKRLEKELKKIDQTV